jgi:hypothetical protein
LLKDRVRRLSIAPHDRRIALLLFLVFWISYGYFFQGGGWHINAFLDLTRALVERGTVFIDAYVDNTGDWAKPPAGTIINKSPGVSFLAVPAYALIRLVVADPFGDPTAAARTTHAITFLSVSLLCAAAGAVFYLALRRRLPVGAAAFLAVVYALGTSNFGYATALVTQAVLGALFILAFHHLEREPFRWADKIGAGLSLAFTVLVEPLSLLAVLVFLGWHLAKSRPGRDWLALALGALPAALLLAWYNTTAMGSPLASAYHYQNPVYNYEGAFLNVLHAPSLRVLYWITFHPIRGLFWLSPVLLLTPLGLYALRKKDRGAAALSALVILVYGLFSISFVAWHAGWCIGPRYLSPSLPFWVLGLAGLFAWRRGWRLLLWALGGLSVAIHTLITAVNIQPPQLAPITNPLTQYILPQFFGGVVSANNQSVLEAGTSNPLLLMTPSQTGASYNLGEALGLTGPASLLPLLLVWAAALALFNYWTGASRPNE